MKRALKIPSAFTLIIACLFSVKVYSGNLSSFDVSPSYSTKSGLTVTGQSIASVNKMMVSFDVEVRALSYNIYGCIDASLKIPVVLRNHSGTPVTSVPLMTIDGTDTSYETLSVSLDPGDTVIVFLADSVKKNVEGAYLVRVILTTLDDKQSNNIANILFHFDRTPEPKFNASEVCAGDTSILTNQTNTSGFKSTSYKWRLSTGDSATTMHVNYFFQVQDPLIGESFMATLVSYVEGCRDSVTKEVVINPIPDATFDHETSGRELLITNVNHTGSGSSYTWDFGDGSTSKEMKPSNLYDQYGSYEICLTVVTSDGCVSEYCENIEFSLGIKGLKTGDLKINLTPNPTAGNVKVEGLLGYVNQRGFSISVFTLHGQKLKSFENTDALDVSDLASGSYIVQVTGNDLNLAMRMLVK